MNMEIIPHRRLFFVLWLLPLLTLLGIVLWALNFTYPLIGHDSLLFLPKLLAGKWHFARHGLAPFRYTPHFCGGLPMYGNPQDMFYSLPQFFTFILDPWRGIQASILIAMLLGYFGWYRFGKDVLRFPSSWAHLLALITLSNGFYLLHMVVGHLTFHTVPLLGLLLWMLYDCRPDTLRTLSVRASGFALTSAYALYAGYPIVLVFAAMAAILLLPLDLLLSEHRRERFRLIFIRALLCGGAALLFGASKLVAIWSFMRFFPRLYPFDVFTEKSASALLFIARSFWYIPQGRFLFEPAGVQWGTHEYSMFLSPVTLMGLLRGGALLIRKKEWVRMHKRLFAALALYAVLLTIFFAQVTRGYGVIPTLLQALPLLQSLHVTSRFLYLFSLFVSAAGIFCIHACLRAWNMQKWERLCLIFANVLTLIALPIAYLPLLQSSELGSSVDYESIRVQLHPPTYLDRPVAYVQEGKLDVQHVIDGTTATRCFEPLFGYHGEHWTTSLTEGPAESETEGSFNLLNPACFQYPEENFCKPGDRIATSDRENFENFRKGKSVSWNLSRLQMVSDWVSVFMLLLSSFMVFWALARKLLRSPK